jgi:hypothetical protein
MSIVEENTADIQLTIPKFNVDVQFNGVPDPLPKSSHFAVFLGPPKSGKSSLSTSFLLTRSPRKIYNGVFDHIYLFVPEGSFRSMTDNPFKALDPSKVKFEFNVATLNEVLTRVEASAVKKQNSLIIIDDFASNLKDVSLRKDFERMVNNRRHKMLSVWVISQTYRAIPLSTRKILTDLYVFRVQNLKEIETIREEMVPRDKYEFQRLYNHVFPPNSDPHNFMYISVNSGNIYNRFNKLVVK